MLGNPTSFRAAASSLLLMSPSSSSLSGASAAAAAGGGGGVGVGGCGGLRVLVLMCCVANLVNAADRVLLPVCMVQMSSHFRWPLSHQGWILSGFGFGYVSSQVSSPALVTNVLKAVSFAEIDEPLLQINKFK